jgi:hypothetical protein
MYTVASADALVAAFGFGYDFEFIMFRFIFYFIQFLPYLLFSY